MWWIKLIIQNTINVLRKVWRHQRDIQKPLIKKDRQCNTQKINKEMNKQDLQNTTQKTKVQASRTRDASWMREVLDYDYDKRNNNRIPLNITNIKATRIQ
jgi:hypothetical protein